MALQYQASSGRAAKVSTPRTQTHAQIRVALGTEALTDAEISSRSGVPIMGVVSALKGMRRRGEVVRLKQRVNGEAYRHRVKLAEKAMNIQSGGMK